jgi:CD109 antigen
MQASARTNRTIMAQAETDEHRYQRELTTATPTELQRLRDERRDRLLWLTAFVLKSFAQAQGLIYIDDSILDEAAAWIKAHQNADGSFDQVGFVCHQDMMGGLDGREALTAYVAIALLEAGETDAGNRAVRYLEGKLGAMTEPYEVAITAYALELAGSSTKNAAYDKLMSLAEEDEAACTGAAPTSSRWRSPNRWTAGRAPSRRTSTPARTSRPPPTPLWP